MKRPIPEAMSSKSMLKNYAAETERQNIDKMYPLIVIITILCFLAMNNILFAQAPDWAWAKSAGSYDQEVAYDLAADTGGNTFITGYFLGTSLTLGNVTLYSEGGGDVFIAKYDPFGNILWAKSGGGSNIDLGVSIATDAMGNVYISGNFYSSTIFFEGIALTNTGTGFSEIFIVKYDPSGNILWAKSAGGSYDDAGYSLTADNFGNIYLSGGFRSPDAFFDGIMLTSSGSDESDAYIAKYNSLGDVQWAKSAGEANYYDYANAVTTDPSGNVYVIGDFSGTALNWDGITLINTTMGFSDIFVLKLDAAGNVTWLKSIGAPVAEYGNGITSDEAGNIYITGNFSSSTLAFGTTILANANASTRDWFIAKYDTAGVELWAKDSYGYGDEDDWGTVTCDAAGDVYAVGLFTSYNLEFDSSNAVFNAGDLDFFIVKYSSSGDVVWVKSAGGEADDYSWSIAVYGVDSLYIAGSFLSSSLNLGTNALTNAGDFDIFIANLNNSSVGVDNVENENAIDVFPNPSTEKITITIPFNEKGELQISNMLGQTVFSKTIQSSKEEIDVSKFPDGIYLVLTATATQKFERKFLKQ